MNRHKFGAVEHFLLAAVCVAFLIDHVKSGEWVISGLWIALWAFNSVFCVLSIKKLDFAEKGDSAGN